jgi:hypothetical protein
MNEGKGMKMGKLGIYIAVCSTVAALGGLAVAISTIQAIRAGIAGALPAQQ